MDGVQFMSENVEGILQLSTNPFYHDTLIHTRDNGVVGVPRMLLLLSSPILRNVFRELEDSLDSVSILLPGFDKSVVESVLQYMSQGNHYPSSEENFKDVKELLYVLNIPFGALAESKGRECEYCGKVLKDKNSLKSHISVMHLNSERTLECPICFKKFKTKGNLKSHSITHGNKEFICETCGFITKTKLALSLHSETHSESRRYKCESCPKSFAVKTYLTHHCQTAHSDARPFQCTQCGKSFKLERQVKSHRRLVHNAKKNIQCLLCSYSCSQMPKMTLHLIVHSGTKPFLCSECPETFKHKEEGRRHAKAKHSQSQVNIKFVINDSIIRLSKTAIRRIYE